MADYPLKQEAAEVQDILDGAFLSNKGQVFTEETKAFMREKIGASATGDGIKILSHFDTLEELQTAVPNPNAGDAFSVGTNLPYNLYIFDFYNGDWRNYGPIRANDIKARFAQNIPVSVSAWAEDTTVFVDYTSKARIALAEVTGNDFPLVAFAPSDAVSGNYCPVAYCFDGYVEIWAKSIPTAAITIPAATFIVQDITDAVTGNSTKGITNASGGIATGGIGTEQIANGSLTTPKYANGSVTRAKLAQDALYSPIVDGVVNRNLTIAELGRTIKGSWNTAVTLTLTQADSATMPHGAEFAVMRYGTSGGNDVTITGDGTRFIINGDDTVRISATIKITDAFGMIAIKKVQASASSGDLWLVTGNVEVVE